MQRGNLDDLSVFLAVARGRSFTRLSQAGRFAVVAERYYSRTEARLGFGF